MDQPAAVTSAHAAASPPLQFLDAVVSSWTHEDLSKRKRNGREKTITVEINSKRLPRGGDDYTEHAKFCPIQWKQEAHHMVKHKNQQCKHTKNTQDLRIEPRGWDKK